MGLSRFNPTRHINILRTKQAQILGLSLTRGYARLPNYCEACKKIIYFPGTRQRFCATCRIAYKIGLNHNPIYKQRRKEKLKNPKYYEYFKMRNAYKAAQKAERLNTIHNKKCKCGEKIHYESKACRSCAAKARPHQRKFINCTMQDCYNKHLAKGLCNKHYQKAMKSVNK